MTSSPRRWFDRGCISMVLLVSLLGGYGLVHAVLSARTAASRSADL